MFVWTGAIIARVSVRVSRQHISRLRVCSCASVFVCEQTRFQLHALNYETLSRAGNTHAYYTPQYTLRGLGHDLRRGATYVTDSIPMHAWISLVVAALWRLRVCVSLNSIIAHEFCTQLCAILTTDTRQPHAHTRIRALSTWHSLQPPPHANRSTDTSECRVKLNGICVC